MKCALLCPGPSLASVRDGVLSSYPLRVAVNRATLRFPCHAWVMLDWKSITRIPSPPIIPLYTTALSRDTLRGRWPLLDRFTVHTTEHRGKTAISALFVAKSLGASGIDVFGADWTVAPDWDGVSLVGTERGEARWAREADEWNAAVMELGIPVRRVQS